MMKIRSLRKQNKELVGPGSPTMRFDFLMTELEKRYPNVAPLSSHPPELTALSCIDEDRKKIKDLEDTLHIAITALEDWALTDSVSIDNQERVGEASARLIEHGSLAYINSVINRCKEALK